MCDVSTSKVSNVILSQSYMWKHLAVYESHPCNVIITLGKKQYVIPEVVPKDIISLVSTKQYRKVITQTRKFVLFMIFSQSEQKVMDTSMSSTHGLSTQQKQVDKIIKEYRDLFTSPTIVPLHYQVKHLIDMIPSAPLPNGPIYRHSLIDNEKIKCQIQELIQKGTSNQAIHLQKPNCASVKEGQDMATLY